MKDDDVTEQIKISTINAPETKLRTCMLLNSAPIGRAYSDVKPEPKARPLSETKPSPDTKFAPDRTSIFGGWDKEDAKPRKFSDFGLCR